MNLGHDNERFLRARSFFIAALLRHKVHNELDVRSMLLLLVIPSTQMTMANPPLSLSLSLSQSVRQSNPLNTIPQRPAQPQKEKRRIGLFPFLFSLHKFFLVSSIEDGFPLNAARIQRKFPPFLKVCPLSLFIVKCIWRGAGFFCRSNKEGKIPSMKGERRRA